MKFVIVLALVCTAYASTQGLETLNDDGTGGSSGSFQSQQEGGNTYGGSDLFDREREILFSKSASQQSGGGFSSGGGQGRNLSSRFNQTATGGGSYHPGGSYRGSIRGGGIRKASIGYGQFGR